ncbi:MAG: AraC-like DNA-binding protein [Saprospiraceae bacterium]|jgi:AraC-like DNA-binding protein
MAIQNVPEIFTNIDIAKLDLFVYDFKMSGDAFKSKVNLNLHMFSFLQKGKKHVHFLESSVDISSKQSILIKRGNCLWSEMVDNDEEYYCKLLFFSENRLRDFLKKHNHCTNEVEETPPYFILENDDYIISYLNSLSTISDAPKDFKENILSVKFEELMLYLINKYGKAFESYLQSLTTDDISTFRTIIEKKVFSNLKIEEIAFLCHMSLSTFKRKFIKEYKTTPGKWLQNKRLQRAKELLDDENVKPSDIYLDFGYKNLSNFSAAFKNKFGKSPSLINEVIL